MDEAPSFETIMRPHMDRVYRLAFRLTANQADAEDLVQDLLIKLYPRRDELSSIENLSPWLGRVLYNLFVDFVRRHPHRRFKIVDLENSEAETAVSPDVVDITPLQSALTQLSDEHRLVILMHDAEGYKLEEIHRITGVALGTLKSRLHRARARLREILK